MEYQVTPEIIGDPLLKLDGKTNLSTEEKRNNWKYAINLNQIDSEWLPSEEYKELIEKEINGELTTEQMRKILNKKYTASEEL